MALTLGVYKLFPLGLCPGVNNAYYASYFSPQMHTNHSHNFGSGVHKV